MNKATQSTNKIVVKNKLSRIKITEDNVTNILLKTYIGNIYKLNFDTYSYLCFQNKFQNTYEEKVMNSSELTTFLLKAEKQYKNVAALAEKLSSPNIEPSHFVSPQQLQAYTLKHVMPSNFNNETYLVLVKYNPQTKKFQFEFGYYNVNEKKLNTLGAFNSMEYKSFIQELTLIRDQWFILQNQNLLIYLNKPSTPAQENNTPAQVVTPVVTPAVDPIAPDFEFFSDSEQVPSVDSINPTTNYENKTVDNSVENNFGNELMDIYDKQPDVDFTNVVQDTNTPQQNTQPTPNPFETNDDEFVF